MFGEVRNLAFQKQLWGKILTVIKDLLFKKSVMSYGNNIGKSFCLKKPNYFSSSPAAIGHLPFAYSFEQHAAEEAASIPSADVRRVAGAQPAALGRCCVGRCHWGAGVVVLSRAAHGG